MGSRHQEYREAVAWLRTAGWRVDEQRGGYPMAFCPCGRHRRSIHLTPSNPNYYRQMRAWVAKRSCWEEAGR